MGEAAAVITRRVDEREDLATSASESEARAMIRLAGADRAGRRGRIDRLITTGNEPRGPFRWPVAVGFRGVAALATDP